MKARDIMTDKTHVVTAGDPVSHAAALMRDSNIGMVPVVDDRSAKRLVGVLTDRDIATRHVADAHDDTCRVGQHMTSDELATVRPDADVQDVYDLMKRRQLRRVLVVDGEGVLIGVIAQADVAVKGQHDSETGEVVASISEPLPPKSSDL